MWPFPVSIEDVVSLLHTIPATLWLIVTAILLTAGVGSKEVGAVHDFAAYRLQHVDLHGTHYGTSSLVYENFVALYNRTAEHRLVGVRGSI